MRKIEEINAELEKLKGELANNQGTTTEVYTRIVGYYRSVRNWNRGKREEYDHRLTYSQPSFSEQGTQSMKEKAVEAKETEPQKELFGEAGKYLYFFRTTCPNCPPVKNVLGDIDLQGDSINVDTPEGLEAAGKWAVFAAPTVIFLDQEGNESFRTSDAREIAARFADQKVCQGV